MDPKFHRIGKFLRAELNLDKLQYFPLMNIIQENTWGKEDIVDRTLMITDYMQVHFQMRYFGSQNYVSNYIFE